MTAVAAPDTIVTTEAARRHDLRRDLRRAGIATLVTAGAMIVTPLSVFAIPWASIDEAYTDPSVWRDPVMTGALGWLGLVYGVQYLVIAVSVATAALSLHQYLGGRLAVAGLAGALGSALLFLLFGGSTAAWYSNALTGPLAALQPDAALRKLIGYGDLLLVQGIMGAAGLGLVVWLIAIGVGARAAGFAGRTPGILAMVFAVIAAALYATGRGAGLGVISVVPLTIAGIWLLVARGRLARSTA